MVGTPRTGSRSPCIICPPDPSGHGHSHGGRTITTVTQSSGSKTTLTKSQKSQYYYLEDYFDKTPKTDYTYARSGSYSKDYLDVDYVVPNLSRPGIRTNVSFLGEEDMSRTTHSTDTSHLLSSSLPVSAMSRSMNERVTRSGSKTKGLPLYHGSLMKKQRKKKADKSTSISTARVLDYDEEDEDTSAMLQNQNAMTSASDTQRTVTSDSRTSTQTNTNYSTSNRTHSSNNNVSRRSNRSTINHMYGLDTTDTELSDNESNYTQRTATSLSLSRSASSASSLASIWSSYVQSSWLYTVIHTYIYTYIFSTLLGGLFSRCWWIIGAPFYWLISQVSVLDVWLLSRTTHYRRRWGLLFLLLLFLLPFLGLGLYKAYSSRALYIPFIFGGREESTVVYREGDNVISGIALEQKIRRIIGDLNIYQNLREEINQVIIQQKSTQQNVAAGLSREEVELIARGILAEKIAAYQATEEEKWKAYFAGLGLKDKDRSEDMKLIQDQLVALQQKTQALEHEVTLATAKLSGQETGATNDRKQYAAYIADLQDQIGGLRASFARIEQTQAAFAAQLKNCCKNATELGLLIQEKVAAALATLMSTDARPGPSSGFGAGLSGGRNGGHGGTPGVGLISFGDWLRNHFVSKEDMDAQLAAVAAKVTGDIVNRTTEYQNAAKDEAGLHVKQQQADTNVFISNNVTTLTERQVQVIVQQALSVFMADKTGMVDYALESAGGCILSTRCSVEYKTGTAQYQIFGIPIYYGSNSPRSVIQPEVHPGNCWAFKGSTGYLVIQLSQTIIPTSFSLEHIPKSLAPTGHIDSAPKEFSVVGLQSENDQDGEEFGNFTYNDNGPPIQFFSIEHRHVKPTQIVELKIRSNQGNAPYTCLYRFRVHGTIATART